MIIYALQHHQQFYSVDSTQTKINKNVFYVSLHLGHNYVCGKCRKMLVKVFSSSRSWSMGVTQKPLQSSPTGISYTSSSFAVSCNATQS